MEATETECANPQLLGWVKEWLDLARERNTKGVTTYKNAYESLKACPVSFQHPSELQQLKGFGPKLCERLTDRLKHHCAANGLQMPEHPQSKRAASPCNSESQQGDGKEGTRTIRAARKPKAYAPAFRSGAYALIVALSGLAEDSTVGLAKTELIDLAQPYCDSSFTAPTDPTKFYTAWNSMKTLVQKELVYERGRPLRRYALTDEGWDVARRIKETRQWQQENGENSNRLSEPHPSTASSVNREHFADPVPDPGRPKSYEHVVTGGSALSEKMSLPRFAPIQLPPGSFSVHLLLDVREVRSKTDRDYMKEQLAKQGVSPIMRSLELGDAQWIAKCKDPSLLSRYGAEGDEIVLDWIVERKRLDDLIGSIKDGRFHEQKFRLKRSGVKKVIYIIEEITMDPASYQRYQEAVQSAIAATQVVNGYFVKKTSKMDDTIKYLARMTGILRRKYERETLHVLPTNVLTAQNYFSLLRMDEPNTSYYVTYPAFASMASKSETMTLRDVFLKMLMTTKGVTGERALEIQKRWKTPHAFVKAFEQCGSGEAGTKRKREFVFAELGHLVGRRKISKATSQKIAEVWGDA